jgi:hypothetical protein
MMGAAPLPPIDEASWQFWVLRTCPGRAFDKCDPMRSML